ncbi:hypothetical protein BJY00DRAFT_299751 [Aspergillus carlsbadensis]|nr:hypothetical protein BJY00DRAFT_299751 [Aspergillus carlsbadensis]
MFKQLVLPLHLILFLALAIPATLSGPPEQCRCKPGETCWPSDDDWRALNETLQGVLVRVRPVGHVCHGTSFNLHACEQVRSASNNSIWRGIQPGALQYTNWESWPDEGQYCYVDAAGDGGRGCSDRDAPCGQGRIALYAAVVESAEQVQIAVQFARDRRLRLVVKNTGHDLGGRSSAPGSFQIATHRLKQIDYTEDFRPVGSGSKNNNDRNDHALQVGPAVTLGAGVLGGELYEAAAAGGYTAIAGLCSTVGVAGGFIQGGGISILSPMLGMASDNAVQFTVVTAEGEIVVANEYMHSDLFWALRGGGGGSFGVVISVTVRVYPETRAVRVMLTSAPTPTTREDFWTVVMAQLYAEIPRLSGRHNFVEVNVFPQDNQVAIISVGTYKFETNDTGAIEKQFTETMGAILDRAEIPYTSTSSVLDPLSASLAARPAHVYEGGIGTLHGSILVSESFAVSSKGPKQMASAFSQLQLRPGDALEVARMAGGKVHNNSAAVDSAVHPSWREALLFVDLVVGLTPASSAAEQTAVKERLTNVQMPLLYGLEDHRMASYYNIPDPGEVDFRRAYWGSHNYERLYAIKQRWDPQGLFVVRLGVGSEDWDEDGMCRERGTRSDL